MDDEPYLGPDARDADLLDGSWETRRNATASRRRDWRAIGAGISLLVLMGLLLPMLAVFTR